MTLSRIEFWAADKAVELHSRWLRNALEAVAGGDPLPPVELTFMIPPTFLQAEHATIAELVRTYLSAIHNLNFVTLGTPSVVTSVVDPSVQALVTIAPA